MWTAGLGAVMPDSIFIYGIVAKDNHSLCVQSIYKVLFKDEYRTLSGSIKPWSRIIFSEER